MIMNEPKHIFTRKIGPACGLALVATLTGCLPGMRDGPPGLPGLPGPPHGALASPPAYSVAATTNEERTREVFPQLVQTEDSVNAVTQEEEANE
jgi:hypothetical protein